MHTIKTEWNFDDSLLILQILLKIQNEQPSFKGYLADSEDSIATLKEILDSQGIPSQPYLIIESSTQKHLGVVLDAAGSLWSPLGIDGVESTLQINSLPSSTSISLNHMELQKSSSSIQIEKIEDSKIIVIEATLMNENSEMETEPQYFPLYSNSSWKNIEKYEQRLNILGGEEIYSFSFKSTPIQKIETLHSGWPAEKFIGILNQGHYIAEKNDEIEKKFMVYLNQKRKLFDNIFHKNATHRFVFMAHQNGQPKFLKVNLENKKLEYDFLSIMGIDLLIRAPYIYASYELLKEKNNQSSLQSYSFSATPFLFKKGRFFHEKQSLIVKDILLTTENWNERLMEQRIYLTGKNNKNKWDTLNMANHSQFKEIVKIEHERLIEQSLTNHSKKNKKNMRF